MRNHFPRASRVFSERPTCSRNTEIGYGGPGVAKGALRTLEQVAEIMRKRGFHYTKQGIAVAEKRALRKMRAALDAMV